MVAENAVRVDMITDMPPRIQLLRRRRIQCMLKTLDVLSIVLWSGTFVMRRPWGLIVAVITAIAALYAGTHLCPLTDDPAERTLANMAGAAPRASKPTL